MFAIGGVAPELAYIILRRSSLRSYPSPGLEIYLPNFSRSVALRTLRAPPPPPPPGAQLRGHRWQGY
jgi:hypothetical protein